MTKKKTDVTKKTDGALAATAPPPPAAKARSPAELADALIGCCERLDDYGLHRDLRDAERAMAAAQARIDRMGERRLRILRAATAEEAEAIARETPADANLKLLCGKLAGWKPLQAKVAADEEVMAVLMKWPRFSSGGMPRAQTGYDQKPHAWVDPDAPDASLSGAKLVEAVRRVMGIGKPKRPPPAGGKGPKRPAPKPAGPAPAKPAGPKKPVAPKKKPPAPSPAEEADEDGEVNRETDEDFEAMDAADEDVDEEMSMRGRASLDEKLFGAIHHVAEAAGRWAALVEAGADDAAIRRQLGEELGIAGAMSAPGWGSVSYRGGKNPRLWAGVSDRGKPTLAGRALVDATRRLMKIPLPQEQASPPSSILHPPSSPPPPPPAPRTWAEIFAEAPHCRASDAWAHVIVTLPDNGEREFAAMAWLLHVGGVEAPELARVTLHPILQSTLVSDLLAFAGAHGVSELHGMAGLPLNVRLAFDRGRGRNGGTEERRSDGEEQARSFLDKLVNDPAVPRRQGLPPFEDAEAGAEGPERVEGEGDEVDPGDGWVESVADPVSPARPLADSPVHSSAARAATIAALAPELRPLMADAAVDDAGLYKPGDGNLYEIPIPAALSVAARLVAVRSEVDHRWRVGRLCTYHGDDGREVAVCATPASVPTPGVSSEAYGLRAEANVIANALDAWRPTPALSFAAGARLVKAAAAVRAWARNGKACRQPGEPRGEVSDAEAARLRKVCKGAAKATLPMFEQEVGGTQ